MELSESSCEALKLPPGTHVRSTLHEKLTAFARDLSGWKRAYEFMQKPSAVATWEQMSAEALSFRMTICPLLDGSLAHYQIFKERFSSLDTATETGQDLCKRLGTILCAVLRLSEHELHSHLSQTYITAVASIFLA